MNDDAQAPDFPEGGIDRRTALQMMVAAGWACGSAAWRCSTVDQPHPALDRDRRGPQEDRGDLEQPALLPSQGRLGCGRSGALVRAGGDRDALPVLAADREVLGPQPARAARLPLEVLESPRQGPGARSHAGAVRSLLRDRAWRSVRRTPPTAGFDRCLTIFRKKPDGWKHILYAQCPLGPDTYIRTLRQKIVQPDFKAFSDQMDAQYKERHGGDPRASRGREQAGRDPAQARWPGAGCSGS